MYRKWTNLVNISCSEITCYIEPAVCENVMLYHMKLYMARVPVYMQATDK